VSRPDRSPDPGQSPDRASIRNSDRESSRAARHAAKRRLPALLACALSLTLGAAGCSGTSSAISDAIGGHGSDPGCIAALHAVSTYGPHAVEDLAQGRERVNRAAVHLLVLALDAAADTADQPSDKQAISTLASVYEDYYDFRTTVVAVPVSTLLKDTTVLDAVCKS
jgi:hypothetical protein